MLLHILLYYLIYHHAILYYTGNITPYRDISDFIMWYCIVLFWMLILFPVVLFVVLKTCLQYYDMSRFIVLYKSISYCDAFFALYFNVLCYTVLHDYT